MSYLDVLKWHLYLDQFRFKMQFEGGGTYKKSFLNFIEVLDIG